MTRLRALITQPRVAMLLLAGFALLAVIRYAYGGVYWPLNNHKWDELEKAQLVALFRLVLDGQPITEVDGRIQYGAVTYFIAHPFVALSGGDHRFIELSMFLVGNIAVIVSLLLVWWRLFRPWGWPGAVFLTALWYTWTPTYHIWGNKNVDTWQLFWLSLGFFLYTSESARARVVTGVPLALGFVMKALPIVVLTWLAIRRHAAVLAAAATTLVVLGISQIVYGPLLGFPWLPDLFARNMRLGHGVALWYENNSVQSIPFKILAGFKLNGAFALQVPPEQMELANWIGRILLALPLVYLAWVGLRTAGREVPMERRAVEYSVALVAMLAGTPNTTHEYMLLALPAYATAIWLLWGDRPVRWPAKAVVTLIVSTFLVGTIVPMEAVIRLLPLGLLRDLTDQHVTDLSQAYRFYGFPLVGLLLILGLLVWLERVTPFRREARS